MSDSDVTYCNSRLQGRADDLPKRDPGPEHHGDGYCERMTDGGRCRYHGKHAGRPAKTGLHSQLRDDLREYVEKAANMDAPGDLTGELAVVRGLLYRRLKDSEGMSAELVNDAHKLLKELRRYSDTLHQQMHRERPSKAEVGRLVSAMGDILKRYVPEEKREAAITELRSAADARGVGGGL